MRLIGSSLESVETVFILWIIGGATLVFFARASLPEWNMQALRRLVHDDRGAAYSLSYVLTFPLFMLIICLVIQCTLILVVKMGTLYAAYATARSAVVWMPAEPNVWRNKAILAARQAIAPFASGSENANPLLVPGAGLIIGDAQLFVIGYKSYAERYPNDDNYLLRKYAYAASATQVDFLPDQRATGFNQEVTVQLTYQMPLRIPVFGRLLGDGFPATAATSMPVRRIQSSVALPAEGFRSPTGLGINYVSE